MSPDMTPERFVLCGPLRNTRTPAGVPAPVRLWVRGEHTNVHLRIEDLTANLYTDVPPAFQDLIDLAAYIYAADQAVRRGGEVTGAGWRRNLVFRVPVRVPDVWRSAQVHEALVSTLSFLSEDRYRFEFEHLTQSAPLQQHFDFGSTAFDGVVEDVALFSGGLDSLAGAVQEAINGGRKVLLVNHRSNEKVTPRHRQLVQALHERADRTAPLHVRVRVNKAKELGRDANQRSRSFLYAALGATFAVMIGRDRLRLYENGVVSLNLPLSAQVVGARATRTTHPRSLAGLSQLLTALAGRPFTIENPFRWTTKADVVRLIADAKCPELIGLTTSCGHTWERSARHPHCGDCSQCIDRRFAVLAAGQEAHDPKGGYELDLLTSERTEGPSRALLAAYLDTATRAAEMTEREFLSRFGEVGRVLGAAEGRPAAVFAQAFRLYRGHAREVTGVIDRAIARKASALRKRKLPKHCLIRMVLDDVTPSAPEPAALPDYTFLKKGQAWVVRFAGGPDNILLPSRGAAYLHALLSSPNKPVSAVALACDVARNGERYGLGDAGERADKDALSAYRVRCGELEHEIDEARENNDPGLQERLQYELDALRGELRRSVGLGGRARKAADDRERIRKAVGVAVRRTIKQIKQFDEPLAAHLGERLQCGATPCYSPNQGIEWTTG